jgi:hypothetical protein
MEEDPSIIEMLRIFDTYYEENSVFKTLFICETEEETYDILEELENNNHNVDVLFYEDIYDERDSFYNKLTQFKSNPYRIFLISYRTWFTIRSELKVYLLPYQNLITLGSIGETGMSCIKNWLNEAKQCGFIENVPNILELYNDNNMSDKNNISLSI